MDWTILYVSPYDSLKFGELADYGRPAKSQKSSIHFMI